MTRYLLDATVRRFGSTMIGGSPLRLFRLTDRGAVTVARIADGADTARSRLTDTLVDAGAIHPIIGEHLIGDDITIIVPTLGPPRYRPPGALLVDDGSDPPVERADVRLPTNRGPAAARNAGLATVTTEFVAFVDSDVTGPDRWWIPLLAHFDDPRVALVAPRVRGRRRPGLLARYERRRGPLDLGAVPGPVRVGSRISYVPSAAVVCRTEAIRQVGGFDESLRYGEDVDLVWRLDAAGRRCRYEPAVVVEHEPRPGWRAWFAQRVSYGRSAAALSHRHPDALAPVRANVWSFAAWILIGTGRPVTGIGVSLAAATALVRSLPDIPARTSIALAVTGTARTGEQLASATRRGWWPLVALLACRSRHARRCLAASLLCARNPLRALDDIGYSVGVWAGIIEARTVRPLLPRLSRTGRTKRLPSER